MNDDYIHSNSIDNNNNNNNNNYTDSNILTSNKCERRGKGIVIDNNTIIIKIHSKTHNSNRSICVNNNDDSNPKINYFHDIRDGMRQMIITHSTPPQNVKTQEC